jgi:quaternary ammonium compound-resistance protein SugE
MGIQVRDGPALFRRRAIMAWIILVIAGLLEVVWAFFMKQSQGFTRLLPSIVTILTMVASFALLSVSMKTLPLGTAYTIWTGIGAVGAFIVGILVLGEQATPMRIVAAILIVSGLVMMKLSSPEA